MSRQKGAANQKPDRKLVALKTLNEIAMELATERDQDVLLRLVVQRATELLSADGGYIYLYHAAQRELELAITYNLSLEAQGAMLRPGVRLRLGEGLAGRVVEQGKSLIVDDYQHWEGRAVAYHNLPIGGAAGVPLRWQGTIIGSLHVHMIEVKRRFSKQDLGLLELFAGHAAIAIGKARFRAEQHETQQLRQRLLDIGQQILQSKDIETILKKVTQAIREHSPFKLVGISLFAQPIDLARGDVGRVVQTVTAGLTQAEEAELRRMTSSKGFVPCQEIIRKGKRLGGGYYVTPALIPEIIPRSIKGRRRGSRSGEWGPYDNLYFMLEQGGQIIGRLSLADPVHGRMPNEDELEPLEILANLATIAILDAGRQRESQRYQERLRSMAIHDPLTGLYNRHYLNEVVEREIARATRYGHPISLLIIDLDEFYHVNDTMGHLVGDRVLAKIAKLIKAELREADFVFRFGGDEFLVLMPETNGKAQGIIERLQEAMTRWNEASELHFPLGYSLGLSTWHPAEGRSFDEALAEADKQMYAHKGADHHKGRKR